MRAAFCRWPALVLLLCLAMHASRPLSGQAPPSAPVPGDSAPPQQPTFRAGVQIIEVDVFVTDRKGNVVRDLTVDDFEIVEGGAAQEIRAFSLVDLPIVQGEPPREDVEVDVATNRDPLGRLYVVLLDGPSTAGPGGRERTGATYDMYAKLFARQFLEEFVAPGDRVAVVHVQGSFEDGQAFTTNKRLMLTSVDRYGRGPAGADSYENLTGPEMVARNMATYRAIEALSARLGAISGRAKAIVWVGGQMTFAPESVPCVSPDRQILCAVSAAAPTLHAAHRDAIAAARRNNVTIHAIDPSGLSPTAGGANDMGRRAMLRGIAEDTGGTAVVNSNNFAAGYRKIVRDHSTYYLLGYTPAADHRDGRFHSIEVWVKRPGLTVRSRQGYLAAARDEERPDVPSSVTAAARDALRLPVPVAGLGLDIFATPFRSPEGPGGMVLLGGHVTGRIEAEGRALALSYRVFKTDGTQQAGRFLEFAINVPPERRKVMDANGLRFVERLPLPPGRYEVRLATDQRDGGIGSVVTHVTVPDFDQRLAMSGLVLAAAGLDETPALQTDAQLTSILGRTPTAVRTFAPGERLSAFLEIYSNDARIKTDQLKVTATLDNDRGKSVKRLSAMAVESLAGVPGENGRWGFVVPVALDGVQAGPYVLTVEAAAKGAKAVRRQVALQVTPPPR